ncbi:hypothetical protein ACFX2I_021002 [Malus domestica]
MDSSLGKLISKSLKRPGDLFFPTHGSELAPPDLQTKKIRMTYKASMEYGGLKPTADRQNPAADRDESSNALPLDPNPTTAQGDQNADLFLSPSTPNKAKAPINIADGTSVFSAPVTGGRDSACRVWDVRLKNVQVHALTGHEDAVRSLLTLPTDPQVISGSHDTTVKLWDLRKGKTFSTLTHHKKSVRAMTHHPKLDRGNCFASASTNTIKKFNLPRGEFLHNMLSQQKSIINAMAVNEDGVMATGGDNGSLWFWDWKSGHNFQQSQTIVQPGSLESEAGIYALCYDVTGTRLVTCEADKTIKMWKQDEKATPETHPLNFRPPNLRDVGRF